jgi:hypothetical protein
MGIFSKLFGRKNKETSKKENEPTTEEINPETSDEVTLEEVNKSLDEVNTIAKGEPAEKAVTQKTDFDSEPKKVEEPSTPQNESVEDKPLYHIKKHSEGWQVIKEGKETAYRVFPYQKEALDFAKQEALDYQVYKADGTLRK